MKSSLRLMKNENAIANEEIEMREMNNAGYFASSDAKHRLHYERKRTASLMNKIE